jgi:hypothetical protein
LESILFARDNKGWTVLHYAIKNKDLINSVLDYYLQKYGYKKVISSFLQDDLVGKENYNLFFEFIPENKCNLIYQKLSASFYPELFKKFYFNEPKEFSCRKSFLDEIYNSVMNTDSFCEFFTLTCSSQLKKYLKEKGSYFFESNIKNIRDINSMKNAKLSKIFDYWRSIKYSRELLDMFFIETFPNEIMVNNQNLHEFETIFNSFSNNFKNEDLKAFLKEKIPEILNNEIKDKAVFDNFHRYVFKLFENDHNFLLNFDNSKLTRN